MDTKEKLHLEQKIEKLSNEIWNVEHLSKILYELLVNNTGNITGSDVCTLSNIVYRTTQALSKQMHNFKKNII